MNERLAKQTGLTGDRVEISIVGIKGEPINLGNCKKIDLQLIGAFGKKLMKGVVTTNNTKMPRQSLPNDFVADLKLPEHVKINPYYNAQVDLLIGQDNWRILTTQETITLKNYDVAISRTPLGWVVHGPSYPILKEPTGVFSSQDDSYDSYDHANKICTSDEDLDGLIKHFFSMESTV